MGTQVDARPLARVFQAVWQPNRRLISLRDLRRTFAECEFNLYCLAR